MGKYLHVIKRHESYGDSEGFNWKYEEFNELLELLGCYMCHEEDIFDRFECDVEEYKRALDLLKLYKANGKTEEVENVFENSEAACLDDIEPYITELGGIDYIINKMEAFYNERDMESDWITFSAW